MISLDVPSLVLTIIVFIVLVGYLNRLLYQPLLNFMDAREAAIKRDEAIANENFAEVGSEQEEINSILKDARDKAGEIRETGLKEIDEDIAKKTSEKVSNLENDFNLFLENLSKEKESLKEELMSNLPDFKTTLKDRLSRI